MSLFFQYYRKGGGGWGDPRILPPTIRTLAAHIGALIGSAPAISVPAGKIKIHRVPREAELHLHQLSAR